MKVAIHWRLLNHATLMLGMVICITSMMLAGIVVGQELGDVSGEKEGIEETESIVGYRIQVTEAIRGEVAQRVLRQLQDLAGRVDGKARRRPVVVLDFSEKAPSPANPLATSAGGKARFEDALAIARFLTGPQSRALRTVAFIDQPLGGHANLVVIACDEFVVSSRASLGAVGEDQGDSDDAVLAVYEKIAAGRGVFPPAVVDAFVRPELGLYRVAMVDGTERFLNGEQMDQLRRDGGAWKEEMLVAVDQPLQISGARLREFRWASDTVENIDQLGARYSIGRWERVEEGSVTNGHSRLLDWSGAINARKTSRVIANLGTSLRDQQLERLVVSVDSQGGSLASSLRLAMMLANPDDGLRQVIGYVPYQALGDSALLAVAASPLYLHPDAILGGEGNEFIDRRAVEDLREAIDEFARISGRPSGLLRGLLDPDLEILRCTDSRTGTIGYLTEEDLRGEPEGKWTRGEKISFSKGLSASQAVELGLAEGLRPSLIEALNSEGVNEVPPQLEERKVLHAIEWLSGVSWLPRLLMFIAFMTFVMEMNAPGLGVPGFISLVCFLLFFWLSFLAGTAEWLEVLLFVGGLACLLLEVFVLPGLGIFGVGGLTMVVLSIVLASQTFVIPQNDYQFQQTVRGLLTVVVAMVGIILGIVSLRYMLPGTPLFKHLSMPGPRSDEMHEQIEREHLVHYENLLGNEGVAVTPLLPGGKAKFGDQIVAVVSQGAAMEVGSRVRVVLVQGNRVVVDEWDAVV